MFHAQAPRLVIAPSERPVSLAEAKAHLRVDATEEDAFIGALIASATDHLDGWSGILGRCLVSQKWSRSFGGFPSGPIALPFPDASSASISYRAVGASEAVSLDDATFHLVEAAEGAFLVLASGMVWPATDDHPAAVTITASYGFGTAAEVPNAIKSAILLLVGDLYRFRETAVIGTVSQAISMSPTVEALLAPYRMRSVR